MTTAGKQPIFRRLAWLCIYYAVASVVLSWVIYSGAFHVNVKSKLHDMVRGTAYRPMVTRAFIPMLIRIATDATPDTWKLALHGKWQSTERLTELDATNGFLPDRSAPDIEQAEHETEYIYMMILEIISLIAIAYGVRKLLLVAYGAGERTESQKEQCNLLAVCFLCLLPIGVPYFLYDFPNLAIWTWAFYALVSEWYLLLCILYPVACITKETSLLLGIVIAYWLIFKSSGRNWSVARKGLLALLIVGLWGGWYWMVNNIYADNPGPVREVHYMDNWYYLTNLKNWFSLNSIGLPIGLSLFLLVPLVWGLARGWKQTPEFFRLWLPVCGCLLALALYHGNIWELRMYYEAAPLFFVTWWNGVRG